VTVVIQRRGSEAATVSAGARARGRGAGGGLYKPRAPIYPKLAQGRWRNIKWLLMAATLTVYYVTPWLRWERPGALPDQAVLVDFAHARFYFFFIQLWPNEVHFITALLVLAALALFLTSSLFGRLWCGYACPQTVWTDLYIHVERLFEGDRNARMRLDAAPWSLDKSWRKIGKHLAWIGIAFGTGGAWIFYFQDAPTLLREFWAGQAATTAYLSCALLTATTYVFAGTMREQVCTYMCPWPRIQGAMMDQHTLQVMYLRDRGEPRGPHKKDASWEGRGDCIDCGQCVVVCPMGIDIRDGSQLECINCGLCVDACDEIMQRIDRPTGLIGYDTDQAVSDRQCGKPPRYRLIRPRTLFYGGLLLIVGVLTVWGLAIRPKLSLNVIRDRNPLFVRMHDGAVRNGYTLKIANHTFEPHTARITVEGVDNAILRAPGAPSSTGGLLVDLPADRVKSLRLFVTASVPGEQETTPLKFTVSVDRLPKVDAQSGFFTGFQP